MNLEKIRKEVKRSMVAIRRTYEPTPVDDILEILSRHSPAEKRRILNEANNRLINNMKREIKSTEERLLNLMVDLETLKNGRQ